jgi:hypothetical protein
MQFDPDDLFLENGILAKGQPLTMLGQGGVGKSRLLLQLAVCSITGLPFLGWKPSARGPRWLVLQAENHNRRLQADLSKLQHWVGEKLWPLVEDKLTIHTVEKTHDAYLNLDDRTNAERIAAVIKEAKADVVVFDPLNAFAVGDLNSDRAMTRTCRRLLELTHLGNPDCAVVVLHHTLTGKKGIAKATGYDRASFGRGSKALQFRTRGQINIAPADPEKNNDLVISCGKNSNGPEFEPFGIRLNLDTMVYELNPDFDHDSWRAEVDGSSVHRKITNEDVAAFAKELPVPKKDLVKALMDEKGCRKSTAYNAINAAEGKTIRVNEHREMVAIG